MTFFEIHNDIMAYFYNFDIGNTIKVAAHFLTEVCNFTL